MRDDSRNWDFIADDSLPMCVNDVRIELPTIKRQTLVSGASVLQQFSPASGWPEVTSGEHYCIAIRRDRVLLINPTNAPEDGWHEASEQAVSDATDAYRVFEISGSHAFELLKRGGEVSHAVPSRSVARLLFQMGVFLYPHKNTHTYRLHVSRAQSQAMLHSLITHAQELE